MNCMTYHTRFAGWLLVAGLTLAGSSLHAQAFDQTVLSFSYADDNLLRDPGETRRNSPDAYFGQQAISSFDRVEESVYRRTVSRLVLAKSFDTGRLSPEGALRVRFSPDAGGGYALADDGTFLQLNYKASAGHGLALRLYPVDSDKLRVGWQYDISWGGSNVFPKNFRRGLVPGLKLSYEGKWPSGFKIETFAGMKTALIRSPSETILDNPGGNTNQFVERAYYGFFGGFGIATPLGLRLDLAGGYFEKGTNTRASVLGKPIRSGGGSAQLSYQLGGKVGHRMDLRLYLEDPERFPLNEQQQDAPSDGPAWMGSGTQSQHAAGAPAPSFGLEAAVEYTRLVQTLEDPDHYASTLNEWSNAASARVGARFGTTRLHVNAMYRELSYIVYNVPGFVPYQAISSNAELTPELFGVVSVDHFFAKAGITPALSVGVLVPASYKPSVDGSTLQGPYAAEVAQGIQKTVVRGSNSGDWDILPAGEGELPVFMAKANVKFNLGRNFSLVGEVTYARDPNLAQVFLDSQGHAIRRFDKPDILGLGIVSELTF